MSEVPYYHIKAEAEGLGVKARITYSREGHEVITESSYFRNPWMAV